ncbi:MAG TPA: ABC transporter permease [Bacteroidales bacterium]|nr:ABC transporter permease [Bacteroidales bacterium]
MNTEFFIARRLIKDKESRKQLSRSIVRIAVIGIALGLAVMIVTVATVTAFKKEIRSKVIGFAAHIQILNFDSNLSYETKPINRNQPFLGELRKTPGIRHVEVFALKPGIIKTKTDIQGVVLKGVDHDYDWTFFRKYLKDGTIIQPGDSLPSGQILISGYIARMLRLKTGDPVLMYFVQDPPRMRRFTIAGMYETGLEEFDKLYAVVDIRHIQKLNDWTPDQVSGFEIYIDRFDDINLMKYRVRDQIGYEVHDQEDNLKVVSITDKYPQIFDWLGLFDINVTIIIVLMLAVAGINMVSGLLILILERTNMIGILKALGTENIRIRRLFLYLSGFLIVRGLFWGNLIGLALCTAQYLGRFVRLDPSAYFLTYVPISFEWGYFFLLNIGTLIAILAMLLIPSMLIARISPDKTIRFN